MPEWTTKDNRKYEHVLESAIERGRNEASVRAMAARTVNRDRRLEGRTPNATTQGTGNPNTNLEERTQDELYNRAKELGISGRSGMSKPELVSAIRNANS